MKPKFLTTTDISRYVQHQTGIKPINETVLRWMRKGKQSYSGKRVQLRFVKKLGRLYSCEQWVNEFLEEVNE